MNRHEHLARERKVSALVTLFRSMEGGTADKVAGLSADDRRKAEAAAGIKLASDTTWGDVVDQLRWAERFDRRVS